jgi:ketosteroid isomerase-like protein
MALEVETMKWIKRAIIAVALVGLGWWIWQRVFVSDETRIRLQLVSMTRAVEQGNLLRLEGAIASDYSDDAGLDKTSLLGGVRAFRQQHNALFIHLSDVRVDVEDDHQKAQAVFVAKVMVKPKDGAGETQLFSDRFRLFFRKTDQGWKLFRAESPELKFD